MRNYKNISLLIVVVIVLGCRPYFGYSLIDKVYADKPTEHSTIGGVNIGNLRGDKLKVVLHEAISNWTSESIVISDSNKSLEIKTELLQFDLDTTVALYESMTKKAWYAFWQPKQVVHLPLQISESDVIKQEIEQMKNWAVDSTYSRLMLEAMNLASHEVKAELVELTVLENEKIAAELETIPETAWGIEQLVDVLNEQVVASGQLFSLLETLGERVKLGNQDALNFIASMLYSIALHTNSEITERTSQGTMPDYLKPGIEAAVAHGGSQDLKFVNTRADSLMLKLTIRNGKLQVEAYAPTKGEQVTVRVVNDYKTAPRVITRYSSTLATDQKEIVEEGSSGLRVSVYRSVEKTGVEERISRDNYQPVHRILLVSVDQTTEMDSTSEQYPASLAPNMSAATDEIVSGEMTMDEMAVNELVIDELVVDGVVIDVWDGSTDVSAEEIDHFK